MRVNSDEYRRKHGYVIAKDVAASEKAQERKLKAERAKARRRAKEAALGAPLFMEEAKPPLADADYTNSCDNWYLEAMGQIKAAPEMFNLWKKALYNGVRQDICNRIYCRYYDLDRKEGGGL